MKYIVAEWRQDEDGEWFFAHSPFPYLDELPNLLSALPAGARAFASDPEHFDLGYPSPWRPRHSVKNLKLRSLPPVVPLPASFDLRFERVPALGDEVLTISYRDVTEVEIRIEDEGEGFDYSDWNSLRLDEILPHPAGCNHEMAFTDATVKVTCADLEARWESPSAGRTGPGALAESRDISL
ncbi:hypothetical protein ACQEU3_42440 [Spirillospora sp. CA-253888]